MTTKTNLLVAALVWASLATTGSVQAQLYKIVDEDGNVTFSQFPPNEPDAETAVENITLEGANDGMTPLTEIGRIQFCGDIELPNSIDSTQQPDRFMREINYSHKSWQRQLTSLEKQTQDALRNQQRYNRHSYYRDDSYRNRQKLEQFQRQEENIKRMRDLRCALYWAENRERDVADYRNANHAELQRLEQVQSNLIANQHQACGPEPKFDPSDQSARARRDLWLECSKKYQRDLRDVSRQLQKVSRSLSATTPR